MMTIEIRGVGSALQGVGRAADGRAVFVPGVLPGETVEVEITREKERFLSAQLVRVVTPDARRAEPPCPYAGTCGGCATMHMTYETTLALKKQRVIDTLTRLGGFVEPPVMDVLGMENPFRVRNKAEYTIARGKMGLMGEGSHDLVAVEDCLCQHPLSIAAMKIAQSWISRTPHTFSGYFVTRVTRAGNVMCILSADAQVPDVSILSKQLFEGVPGMCAMHFCRLRTNYAHALDGACTRVAGENTLTDTLGTLSFRLQPQSFFQVNPVQAEVLYGVAEGMAALSSGQTLLDAYCGAGTITLWMARGAGKAIGIEVVTQAIDDALYNARINNLGKKTQFMLADAAKALPEMLKKGLRPDVVCVDPPRKGVDPALLQAVIQAKVPRVVYVSCDPATLSRDLKGLREGGYTLKKVQPVDMFPWTAHIECACLMVKNKN
ncbi:MAG: 23S rRNA (uracil(1939)-C(5))-methyltransferase RlmD [Clostridia bacterium]